ncbi:MAG TPA: glycine--tRNA ligase subunit beta [Steroidobacteraceae bacterium]|nr:glycine--tRNA ligase subunit beta [Steroidobacteraceae bacterium]
MSACDFLVEIGTEELPPKSLFALAESFAHGIDTGLTTAALGHDAVEWFATPRRLAVRVTQLAAEQPDQQIRRQGPAVAQAFDKAGAPTKAALGFAASCGVAFEALEQADGPKGRVLQYVATKRGEASLALLPNIVNAALAGLPIARRMRWGSSEQEFVRPVHWVVMLFGDDVIEAEVLGIRATRNTHGHRFHAPQALSLRNPSVYEAVLKEQGHVIAALADRRALIETGTRALAQSLGGEAVIEPALLDEVAALVEWPVPIAGRFDERFLSLPAEVPIATMQDHQRYFPVRKPDGQLMNHFITIANIDSRDPAKVRDGNERVIRPRLADAAFFWETDRKQRLDARCDMLRSVTFQAKLGSLYEKSERVATLAMQIANAIEADAAHVERAAKLSKCDLLSAMVGEFPELQGLMGKYYAQHDGEAAEVALAIEEQYLPRFAGDQLPQSKVGIALAIADKLDTIAGIFAIGQKPTGARDPFGLRRAALGILRICVERGIDLDLRTLVQSSYLNQPMTGHSLAFANDEIWPYLMERLRAFYLEKADRTVTTEMFDAVTASQPGSPIDIDQRLRALEEFLSLPEAQSLAAANKRIANILKKSGESGQGNVVADRLLEVPEQALFEQLQKVEAVVGPSLQRRAYSPALRELATLRDAVDRFFDSVMVMTDDVSLRANRLALLSRLRALFLGIADLSRLPG